MRPNITIVGGLGTENGTRGALAADLRNWFNGRLQTLAGVTYSSINLDFYGIGHDSVLAEDPLRYNLEPTGGLFEGKIRLGSWPLWIGASYTYAQTGVRFDAPEGTPGRPETARWSTEAGITPSVTLDTRNNMFTPTRGTYVEARGGLFSPTLGGDDSFQRLRLVAMQFVPFGSRLFFGVRGEAAAALGDTPFYLKPFVYQRGVPAMRYMGEEMAQLETEIRWQFWNRFSLVGFAGAGQTWAGSEGEDRSDQVTAGGAGFRYELARTYGLHVGADVATGPTGGVFYIQFGSAWARP
jgi:outer membrane protein assembly factor BamA